MNEVMGKSVLMKPFYKLATFLYHRAFLKKLLLLHGVRIKKALKDLHPFGEEDRLQERYYVEKMALCLMIAVVGTLLAAAACLKGRMENVLEEDGSVIREEAGEGHRTLKVTAAIRAGKDVEKKQFQIEIAPRKLNRQEMEEQYRQFARELPNRILGENPSLQEVSQDLLLLESYEGYPFLVEWISGEPGLVSGSGTVYENGVFGKVELTARISCEEEKWELVIPVRTVPVNPTPGEQEYREMEAFLIASEKEAGEEAVWELPKVFKGQRLEWEEVKGKEGTILWITSMVCAGAVYYLSDRDLHEKARKRGDRMKREYPAMLHKLVLYLGAGMTVRSAFLKVAGEGFAEDGVTCINPVYEEMLYTCREIQAGVSERTAYERFGKRTGVQEYVRLAMLLSQNLKKGNTSFTDRLREEAGKAWLEQMHRGRRLAEEAVTKLLLPMGMLLVVVMVMIMAPAFSSMGM